MIDFLQSSVDDERFEFHHVDLHNELYNPGGERLTASTRLPVAREAFDLICLFSVFTHLAPDDFNAMLHVLREHVRPDGHLFFSLFVNEETEGGHGFVDSMVRAVRDRPELVERRRTTGTETPRFRDVFPAHPLRVALYSEDYARELMEGTGWRPVKLLPPDRYIQHSFLCVPD
jgi:SAM-dependent methyltransferase